MMHRRSVLSSGSIAALALACLIPAVVAAPAAGASTPVAHGPDYPPPGGATLVSTGDAAAAGGISWGYSAFDSSAFSQIAWGLDGTPIYVAMEGAPAPSDDLSFNATLSNLPAGQLVWTGTTSVTGLNYSGPVATELVVTLTDVAAAAVPMIAQSALPDAGVFDATLPAAVGNIGAVAPLPPDGLGNLRLKANLQFLAGIGTPAQAADVFFDSVQHTGSSAAVQTSVGAGFYWTSSASATLSPATSTDLGSVPVGATGSTVVHATLTSGGSGDLHLDSTTPVAVTGANPGDFAISSSTCTVGAVLAQAATCTFDVTFAPQQRGARAATVVVNDNALDSPQSFPVTGTGTAPAASVLASFTDFGAVPVGTSAPTPATVTVTSTNAGTLHLDGTTPVVFGGPNAGDFAVVGGGTCSPGLALTFGSSCTFAVSFVPGSSGARSATLGVVDDAADSPQVVAFSGSGTLPALTFDPSGPMDFGQQLVGSTSAPRTLHIRNTGQAPLQVNGASFSGDQTQFDFTPGSSCGVAIPVGGSCDVTVDFKPSTLGLKSMSLSLTDNAPGSPHTYTVQGTGATIDATLAPNLSYGSVNLGSTVTRTATLTNTGVGTLVVTNVSIAGVNPGDFALTGGTCGVTPIALTGGSHCTIKVRFAPAAAGPRSGALVIADNAASGPTQSVTLTGKGIAVADLGVSIAASPVSAKVGQPLRYTITVANYGPSSSKAVHVVDTLPSFSTFTSITAPGWTCTTPVVGATGTVVCNRASLASGAHTTITIVVTVHGGIRTSLSDTATASASTPDPEPANNTATVTVSVSATAAERRSALLR